MDRNGKDEWESVEGGQEEGGNIRERYFRNRVRVFEND